MTTKLKEMQQVLIFFDCWAGLIMIIIIIITITKFSNLISTALISALIGQFDRTVRVMPK